MVKQHLHALVDVWKAPQVQLAGIIRWSQYVASDGVREQSTLAHTHALTLLGTIVLELIGPHYPSIDESLVLTALTVHDHGEGEVGYDTLYKDKSWQGDLKEYEAFVARISGLPPAAYRRLQRAFLLQFALSDQHLEGFPEEAQTTMRSIRLLNQQEAHLFEALERFDYMMFAFEQHLERGHRHILKSVVANQAERMDELALLIPGFSEEIWTSELRAWVMEEVAELAA